LRICPIFTLSSGDSIRDTGKEFFFSAHDEKAHGVALVQPQYGDQITEYVKGITQQLEKENHPFDFWAYCAPGRLRALQSAKSKNYFPMVLLLASNARTWYLLFHGKTALKNDIRECT